MVSCSPLEVSLDIGDEEPWLVLRVRVVHHLENFPPVMVVNVECVMLLCVLLI